MSANERNVLANSAVDRKFWNIAMCSQIALISQFAHNMLTMCSQCAHNVLAIAIKLRYSLFGDFAHNLLTICSQIFEVSAICSQSAHNLLTILGLRSPWIMPNKLTYPGCWQ